MVVVVKRRLIMDIPFCTRNTRVSVLAVFLRVKPLDAFIQIGYTPVCDYSYYFRRHTHAALSHQSVPKPPSCSPDYYHGFISVREAKVRSSAGKKRGPSHTREGPYVCMKEQTMLERIKKLLSWLTQGPRLVPAPVPVPVPICPPRRTR